MRRFLMAVVVRASFFRPSSSSADTSSIGASFVMTAIEADHVVLVVRHHELVRAEGLDERRLGQAIVAPKVRDAPAAATSSLR